jgi:DNA-binding MarR family transcriptional regulator
MELLLPAKKRRQIGGLVAERIGFNRISVGFYYEPSPPTMQRDSPSFLPTLTESINRSVLPGVHEPPLSTHPLALFLRSLYSCARMLQKQLLVNEEPIGLLIAAARRRMKQVVGGRVRRHHLTAQQFWVLVAVYERPHLPLHSLAVHLHIDDPTASRIVFSLVRRKLLQSKTDPSDRRRTCLQLGAAGEALGNILSQVAQDVRQAVVREMTEAEQNTLRVLLRKVIANMDSLLVTTTEQSLVEGPS